MWRERDHLGRLRIKKNTSLWSDSVAVFVDACRKPLMFLVFYSFLLDDSNPIWKKKIKTAQNPRRFVNLSVVLSGCQKDLPIPWIYSTPPSNIHHHVTRIPFLVGNRDINLQKATIASVGGISNPSKKASPKAPWWLLNCQATQLADLPWPWPQDLWDCAKPFLSRFFWFPESYMPQNGRPFQNWT